MPHFFANILGSAFLPLCSPEYIELIWFDGGGLSACGMIIQTSFIHSTDEIILDGSLIGKVPIVLTIQFWTELLLHRTVSYSIFSPSLFPNLFLNRLTLSPQPSYCHHLHRGWLLSPHSSFSFPRCRRFCHFLHFCLSLQKKAPRQLHETHYFMVLTLAIAHSPSYFA